MLAFFTSAFSSYSGCRQYREDIFRAQAAVGPGAPEVLKLRAFYNHPGFVEANADRVRAAFAQIPEERRAAAPIVFTAHSIPTAMAERCRYADQLAETSRLVAEAVGVDDYAVVYQSRSGPPHVPWLEPDVLDHLRELARPRRDRTSSISPVGFVSDHLEVLYDLDIEAAELGEELGVNVVRAGTAGTHPAFVVDDPRADRGAPRTTAEKTSPQAATARATTCARQLLPPRHGRPEPLEQRTDG